MSLISCSELFVTRDTAKYLVLTLSRGCALSPFDPINPNYPLHSFSEKEKEKIETRLFRSCVPMITRRPPPTYQPYICRSPNPGSHQRTPSRQSPHDKWLHGKQSSLGVLQIPLFLGGHPQVNIPQVKPLGTTLNSQQPIKPKSTQVFI